MHFSRPTVDRRFEEFKAFVGGRESDTDFLEMAASFHFLERGGRLSRTQIFERVLNKRRNFTESDCREAQDYLERWGLIKGAGNDHDAAAAACGYGDEPDGGCFEQVAAVPESMDLRPVDKGIYHMLLDSKEGNEKIVLVGRDVFRPDQRHPPIDEITVEDKRLLVDLFQRG